jgi:nucleotide-binding universal stress UspA family protein
MMVYKNILIPTDGMKAGEDVIEFICFIQKVIQAVIHVIYVLEVPRNLPLDAEQPEKLVIAKAAIDKAIKIAGKYQVVLNTSIVYARSTEEAIISTAADLKCDVIAIAQDNHKLGIFANTAATIYQKAKCNIWLFNNKG